jgi:flavin reductase (NADH)
MAMRTARRRWASGVAVAIVPDGDGYRGVTVTSFNVVSLAPPQILLCLDPSGRTTELIERQGVFTVSVLDRGHEALAERFAGRGPLVDPALTGVRHRLTTDGLPVLDGVLAWFACRVAVVYPGGDHRIIVGDVATAGVGVDTDDPLIYYEGSYRRIEGD